MPGMALAESAAHQKEQSRQFKDLFSSRRSALRIRSIALLSDQPEVVRLDDAELQHLGGWSTHLLLHLAAYGRWSW
jgi:hypothetical protein